MIAVWGGLKTSTSVIIIASVLASLVSLYLMYLFNINSNKKEETIYEADLENILLSAP